MLKRLSEARTAGMEMAMAMAMDEKREDDRFWWDVRAGGDQEQKDIEVQE